MIRVRLDEPGEDPAVPPAPPDSEEDWHTLNDLALATLLLAHRLRAQQRATQPPDPGSSRAEPPPDSGPGPPDGPAGEAEREPPLESARFSTPLWRPRC